MAKLTGMRDILEARRAGSDAKWAGRPWHPVSAYVQPEKVSPQGIKEKVVRSSRLRHIIKQISEDDGIPVSELYVRVREILDEIGYNRELPVLRWLGLFTSKILKRLCSAIYINEETLLKVKSSMGRNPVLFVPTHKSYGDFILMSFVCFYYELDIPRIAAGMDFHGMKLMGEILRDSCAFFMRRSFAQDKVYSATFSEYVETLVTHGDGAVEFFIEGTRSRTAKSLMPKFGFLAMALRPYLTGLVPDISIVPVNICYDRCLEEKLFCYELLGVPKPKESTKGFFKAMSVLKENYGKVFITVGEPISVAESLAGHVDRSLHSYGPALLQGLTGTESKQMVRLAHNIINKQRELTVLTCFNVVAAILNDQIQRVNDRVSLESLVPDVFWLSKILKDLGARVDMNDESPRKCIEDSIILHKSLLYLNEGRVMLLVSETPALPETASVRGCKISPSTMNVALPFMLLQHYVNPCSQYIVFLSFIVLAVKWSASQLISNEVLRSKFHWIHRLFSHEFVCHEDDMDTDYQTALKNASSRNVICMNSSSDVCLGDNEKLILFLGNFLAPFLPAYVAISETIHAMDASCIAEKELMVTSQERVQQQVTGGIVHPANLSLDTLNNAIQAFCVMDGLRKTKRLESIEYIIIPEPASEIHVNLSKFLQIRTNVYSVLLRSLAVAPGPGWCVYPAIFKVIEHGKFATPLSAL